MLAFHLSSINEPAKKQVVLSHFSRRLPQRQIPQGRSHRHPVALPMKSNETMCSEPRRASRLMLLVGIAATCSFCAIAQTFAAASFNEGLLEIQAVSHALIIQPTSR